MANPTVAIVGTGPSGCYVAQALRKAWPGAEIAMFDRLPVPYGLVRYGVAPDHSGTKSVIRQFERLFEREHVRFIGNLEIGKDLPLEELRRAYDIVVLATGLYGDRRLSIPGDDLERIYGAGRMTRLLNDHPDEVDFVPRLGRRTVIVGNGNVAIDLLRLLTKSHDEFEGSDLSDESLAQLLSAPLDAIDIVGRSPAALAKFDTVMVKELARLANVRFEIGAGSTLEPATSAQEQAKIEAILALREAGSQAMPRHTTVTFHFGWVPEAIHGEERVEAISFVSADGSGQHIRLEADSVVTAIGFQEQAGTGLNRDALSSETTDIDSGFLASGLYCAGWFRRGPRGTIPENRADAKAIADNIVQAVSDGALAIGKPGYSAIPDAVKEHLVDYQGWKRIDKAELSNAPGGRVRRKVRTRTDMLSIAHENLPGVQQ
ncbi:FAD-dependent oxidoreductase [Pseudomonas sp. Q1-7]|uniref:FAD-dependent oxidoreductase n=1 Tax=Pseudomonas sp. Q1-7 TaxID=3020843 RepID=UPI002300A111|nr:FAD-dependent oxidoreductase [Pseudomonas sp. Q1-7]